MQSATLSSENRAELADKLAGGQWIVACLCAAWCDVCRQYRAGFDALAAQHPDKCFVWIDVEDQADVVGDIDVENFPTLLIQHRDTVAFFGTVLPDPVHAHRLLLAQVKKNETELVEEASSSDERRRWQQECNLQVLLSGAMGS